MRRSSGRVGAPRAMALALALAAMAMGACLTHGERTTPSQTAQDGEDEPPASLKERAATVTGSRLPDCAHACGPCAPCKRVMVSLRCVDDAESCPIAYRCMCRGRFFRVPTL